MKKVPKDFSDFYGGSRRTCSLAQALLCFILMAVNDRNKEVDIPESARDAARIKLV